MAPDEAPDLASVLKTLSSLRPSISELPSQRLDADWTLTSTRRKFNDLDVVASSQQSSGEVLSSGVSNSALQTSWGNLRSASSPNPNAYSIPREVLNTFPFLNQPTAQVDISKISSDSRGPQLQTSTPVPNPSLITEWPTGLRFVTKAAAINDEIGIAIRRMISSQHEHEKQWYSGRETLIRKQRDRIEGKQKLDDVLRAVGGKIPIGANTPNAADELLRYDKKVHKAFTEMAMAMSAELKILEIPFFCIDPLLITEEKASEAGPESNDDLINRKVNQIKLLKLQRRMLEFLEDMFKE